MIKHIASLCLHPLELGRTMWIRSWFKNVQTHTKQTFLTQLPYFSSWNLFQCSWYCNPACSIYNVTLKNHTQLAKLRLYRTLNNCNLLKLNTPSSQQCLRALKSLMRWPSQFSHLPHNLIQRRFVKLAARWQLLRKKQILWMINNQSFYIWLWKRIRKTENNLN